MNLPKVNAEEYIQFLVASPVAVSGTEAARVHAGLLVAHDAYTRVLHLREPEAAPLRQEAQGLVAPTSRACARSRTVLWPRAGNASGGKATASCGSSGSLPQMGDGGTEGAEYWASSDLDMSEARRAPRAALGHRTVPPRPEAVLRGGAQVRAAKAPRNHIGYALRTVWHLEAQRLRTGRSWYEAKKQLLRDAIRAYLGNPTYLLHPAAA